MLRPDGLSQWLYFIQRLVMVHTLGLATQAKFVARRVFSEPGQEALRQIAVEQISSANPRAYRAAMRSLGLFDSRKCLSKLNNPTLVITGANDSTVAPHRQKMLTDNIPGARQVVIPNAGHAVNVDQFEAFNKVLLEFLCET